MMEEIGKGRLLTYPVHFCSDYPLLKEDLLFPGVLFKRYDIITKREKRKSVWLFSKCLV